MRWLGVTSKAEMIAFSIAIVDCWIGAVRPKVPGLKSGCLLDVILVEGGSSSGSFRVVQRAPSWWGDLDLGRGVRRSSWMIELLGGPVELVVISGVSSCWQVPRSLDHKMGSEKIPVREMFPTSRTLNSIRRPMAEISGQVVARAYTESYQVSRSLLFGRYNDMQLLGHVENFSECNLSTSPTLCRNRNGG